MERFLNKLCKVNTCFLIADVQAGSAIIGYLDLISGGMMLVVDIAAFIRLRETGFWVRSSGNEFMFNMGVAIIAFNFLMTVVKVLVSVILILGVKMNKPNCVLLWLYTSMIFMLAYILSEGVKRTLMGFDSIISSIILIWLQFYYTLVVNSYYFEMKAEGERIKENQGISL